MNNKIKIITMITLFLLFTIGCGKADTNSIDNTTYGYNKDTIESEIKEFLIGESTNNLESFDNELKINTEDLYGGPTDGMLVYYTNGAAYLQIDRYMYRFQFNKQHIITSYIKYNLEA